MILTADGYIATNYHALQGPDELEIRFFPDPAGSEDYKSFNAAKVLYLDPEGDIAVLKVNSNSLPFLEYPAKTSGEPRIGQTVYAIGNPKGLNNTISAGIVSGLRSVGKENVIQHTAAISPGSSGGALVDANGHLLGMNSWQVADAQNLNFAISATLMVEALDAARHATAALRFPPDAPTGTDEAAEDRTWKENRAAVESLRNAAALLKRCPRETHKLVGDTEGPLSGAEAYWDPPVNVLWDVTQSGSVRSPYSGYIEFTVPIGLEVPEKVLQRWSGRTEVLKMYADLGVLNPNLTKYRYEFDVGPRGLQLTRTLLRSKDDTEWKDADLKAKDNRTGRLCWQEVILSAQKTDQTTQ